MIYSLLKTPDSTKARRCKSTGRYAYEHYYRERVLAVAGSADGQAAKRRRAKASPSKALVKKLARELDITESFLEKLAEEVRKDLGRSKSPDWHS
jgi:transcriptional regulator with XRE-family HTH domain